MKSENNDKTSETNDKVQKLEKSTQPTPPNVVELRTLNENFTYNPQKEEKGDS